MRRIGCVVQRTGATTLRSNASQWVEVAEVLEYLLHRDVLAEPVKVELPWVIFADVRDGRPIALVVSCLSSPSISCNTWVDGMSYSRRS